MDEYSRRKARELYQCLSILARCVKDYQNDEVTEDDLTAECDALLSRAMEIHLARRNAILAERKADSQLRLQL